MAKPSHGGAHFAAAKKRNKKRSGPQPEARVARSSEAEEAVEARVNGGQGSDGSVVRFRPRPRDAAAARSAAARVSASSKAFQQVVDYSYVYTDLRIIGALSLTLFAGMLALSFVLR